MAIPTVNSLAQVIMREFGEAVDNDKLVSQVEAWIQDTYDEIGIQAEWKYLWEMESLVTIASQTLYNLTGFFDQDIACINTVDNTPLTKKLKQYLMENGFNLSLAGKPVLWYVEKYNSTLETYTIGFYPVPDAVYTFRFLGLLQPQELDKDTKLPFPREFIFLIKDGVKMRFKEDDKDYNGADRLRQRYNANLLKLKQRSDSSIAIRPRMEVMDISSNREMYVGLPPEHFSR